MLRRILVLFLLLGCAASAFAQTLTTVTGTITDPNGIPYSNATVNIQLAPTPPGPATCLGQPIRVQGAFQTDANGSFTTTLCANANILPASSQWQFNVSISPGVLPPLGFGPQSFSVLVTISTSSPQSVSSALSAAAPALSRGAVSAGVSSVNSTAGAITLLGDSTLTITQSPTGTFTFHVTSSGGGFTPSVNGTPLGTAGLNLINSSTNSCGLTSTFTNTTSVTVQNEIAGTLLNGCLPFAQVNSGNLASRGMSNFINSTVNAIGLTDSVSNPATNQVKHEAGGLLNATGGGCGVSNPTAHSIAVAEGASNCNYVTSNRTGDAVVFNTGADPAAVTPAIATRQVTIGTAAPACVTSTTQGDNMGAIELTNAGGTTVTVPDANSTGCPGNSFQLIAGPGSGTVTVNRTTSSSFRLTKAGSASVVTTFTMAAGDFTTFKVAANGTDWQVTQTTGGTGSTGLSGMTATQVPIAATASTVTSSKAIVGTDAGLASAATISTTPGTAVCSDANGGVTTTGCSGAGAVNAPFLSTAAIGAASGGASTGPNGGGAQVTILGMVTFPGTTTALGHVIYQTVTIDATATNFYMLGIIPLGVAGSSQTPICPTGPLAGGSATIGSTGSFTTALSASCTPAGGVYLIIGCGVTSVGGAASTWKTQGNSNLFEHIPFSSSQSASVCTSSGFPGTVTLPTTGQTNTNGVAEVSFIQ